VENIFYTDILFVLPSGGVNLFIAMRQILYLYPVKIVKKPYKNHMGQDSCYEILHHKQFRGQELRFCRYPKQFRKLIYKIIPK